MVLFHNFNVVIKFEGYNLCDMGKEWINQGRLEVQVLDLKVLLITMQLRWFGVQQRLHLSWVRRIV
jgi:hypothetical protein